MAAVYDALGLAFGERVALHVGNRFEFVEAAYRDAGRSSQFPDQNLSVDSHRRQRRATQLNEKIEYATAKPRLKPTHAATGPRQHHQRPAPDRVWLRIDFAQAFLIF
jgi:hypothetical protein